MSTSLANAIRAAMRQYAREDMDDMIPARIVSYDRSTNRAVVQPLINSVDNDGKVLPRQKYGNIPVLRPGGGNNVIINDLPAGSYGWLKASDRDYTTTINNDKQAAPNTERSHSFSDGLFIPDMQFNVTPGPAGTILQNKSGTAAYGIDSSGKPTVTSSAEIVLTAPQISANGDMGITSGGKTVSMSSGNVTIGGTPSNSSHAATKGMLDNAVSSINTTITNLQPKLSPAGQIAMFAMTSPPTGWLKCNGAAVSRTTYSDLFAAIGTTWGSGDGSTTFNVPDMRGRFARALDDGKGIDSGRSIATTQASQNKSHTHTGTTGTQSANHSHSGTTGTQSADHAHPIPVGFHMPGHTTVVLLSSALGSNNSPIGSLGTWGVLSNHAHSFTTGGISATHTHSFTTAADGGTEARPDNIAIPFFIKY